jgi:NTP pyrophosphatase (non-canonical NTP hydrolase)
MDIGKLQKKVIEFRDARDCGQYHNPKDLTVCISLEAAELLEIFQWKDAQEVEASIWQKVRSQSFRNQRREILERRSMK